MVIATILLLFGALAVWGAATARAERRRIAARALERVPDPTCTDLLVAEIAAALPDPTPVEIARVLTIAVAEPRPSALLRAAIRLGIRSRTEAVPTAGADAGVVVIIPERRDGLASPVAAGLERRRPERARLVASPS